MSYSVLKLSNHEVLEFNIFLEPKMALKVLSEQFLGKKENNSKEKCLAFYLLAK